MVKRVQYVNWYGRQGSDNGIDLSCGFWMTICALHRILSIDEKRLPRSSEKARDIIKTFYDEYRSQGGLSKSTIFKNLKMPELGWFSILLAKGYDIEIVSTIEAAFLCDLL